MRLKAGVSGSCTCDGLNAGEAGEGEAAWWAAVFSLDTVMSWRVK